MLADSTPEPMALARNPPAAYARASASKTPGAAYMQTELQPVQQQQDTVAGKKASLAVANAAGREAQAGRSGSLHRTPTAIGGFGQQQQQRRSSPRSSPATRVHAGPNAEVLRLMADHVAEHKRRLEKVELFNATMTPVRGWSWKHTVGLLLYTTLSNVLAIALGGVIVSSMYGAQMTADGVAFGGSASDEPAVLVVADESSSHVHVRASATGGHSATVLVGDSSGVLIGGDCDSMRQPGSGGGGATPASICSGSDGLLTLSPGGTVPAARRMLAEDKVGGQHGVLDGGTTESLGDVRTIHHGLTRQNPAQNPGGVQRRLQEVAANSGGGGGGGGRAAATVRVDGALEVAHGLQVLAQPLEVIGLLRALPAQRAVYIGTADRNLPPSSLTVHGSVEANRVTVTGSTFLQVCATRAMTSSCACRLSVAAVQGNVRVTAGNLEVEQNSRLGSVLVTGTGSFLDSVTIGDGNGDTLTVHSDVRVTEDVQLSANVTIGQPADRHAASVIVHSPTRMHSDVNMSRDLAVMGDIFSPVINTETGSKKVVVPPVPLQHPDFLHFPCGWDLSVTACINVSALLAAAANNTTAVPIDIGTDPLCEDDLNGTLSSLQPPYSCAAAIELVTCAYDLSQSYEALQPGTTVSDLCPVSCSSCVCRPPWCVPDVPGSTDTPLPVAVPPRVTQPNNHTNSSSQPMHLALARSLATLHGVDERRIQVISFQNKSRADQIVQYRIVPSYDWRQPSPAEVLALMAARGSSVANLIVCPSTNATSTPVNIGGATGLQLTLLSNTTNATNASALVNSTNATNCTVAVPYEQIYPPPPPVPPVFVDVVVTNIFLTGDTTMTRALKATSDVTLGVPSSRVSVFAPTNLTSSLSVSGLTTATEVSAVGIDTQRLLAKQATAHQLEVGGDLHLVRSFSHRSLRSTGGAVLMGDIALGQDGRSRHDVTGSTFMSGDLTVQGSVTMALSTGSMVTIRNPTFIYSNLQVTGGVDMGHVATEKLRVNGPAVVTGAMDMQGDCTLGLDATKSVLVKGSTKFESVVNMHGSHVSATGNVALGTSSAQSLVVNSATVMHSTLHVSGTVTLGQPPRNFDYFYEAVSPSGSNRSNISTRLPTLVRRAQGPELMVHTNVTMTADFSIYGSTNAQLVRSTKIQASRGAVLGSGPNDATSVYGQLSLHGNMQVTGNLTCAGSNSQVRILSPTTVDSDFSALGNVLLGVSTARSARIQEALEVDGRSQLRADVVLGSNATHEISIRGRTFLSDTVTVLGPSFTATKNAQLGSTAHDTLFVNASATLFSGMEVHGSVALVPNPRSESCIPTFSNATQQDVDNCASANLTVSSGASRVNCESIGVCTYIAADSDAVSIGAPTLLASSLSVAGAVSLGTPIKRSPFGIVLAPATMTSIMGDTVLNGAVTIKSAVQGEDDITVVDGKCRSNCVHRVHVDAMNGGVSVTGNAVVGGILNPSSVLKVGSQMLVNVINEHASNTGVTVEGITFIDGGFERATVDTFREFTLNHGVDIEGILLRDGVVMLESQLPGFSSKGELDMLTLTNSGNSDDMDGTKSTLLFRQFYYDPSIVPSNDPQMDAVNAKEAGKIVVGTETDWTAQVASRDSFLAFEVSENGHMYERMRLASNGDITMSGTDGSVNVKIGAQSGDIAASGTLRLTDSAEIFFQDKYTVDLLSSGDWKFAALHNAGAMTLDMGVAGTITAKARQFNMLLEQELVLGSDLRVTGTTRYATGADSFSIDQRGVNMYLSAGTSEGSVIVNANQSTFNGDLTLQPTQAVAATCPGGNATSRQACEGAPGSPTGHTYTPAVTARQSARLSLLSDTSSFRLEHSSTSSSTLKLQYSSSAVGTHTDLATLEGTGAFKLKLGPFEVADVLSVNTASAQTTVRGALNLLSQSSVETASISVHETAAHCTNAGDATTQASCEGTPGALTGNTWTASTPETRISTAADRGSVIVLPGLADDSTDPASGFFKVKEVFSVRGSDGETKVAGNWQVGGLAGSASSAKATILSGSATGSSTLSFSDGTSTFDIVKSRQLLSIISSHAAGVIDVIPGMSGQFRINYDRFSVSSESGSISARGNMTLGNIVSRKCADDDSTGRSMDCIFPFVHNGISRSACVPIGAAQKCATRVNEVGQVVSWGSNCRACPEGPRHLHVLSADDISTVSVSGVQGANAYGQLQLGQVHTLTSVGDSLSIAASSAAGTINVNPGQSGAFNVFGQLFRISGGSGNVVGLGDWSIGDLAHTGASALRVVSPDAEATITVNASASNQEAAVVVASSIDHNLILSQAGASGAVRGTGTLEVATLGVLLDAPTAVTGTLTLGPATAQNGALTPASNVAALSTQNGNLQLTVSNGDILMTGNTLRMNNGKFTVDGTNGNTGVAGQLNVGLISSNVANLVFTTATNSFGVSVTDSLTVTSTSTAADIWLKPGTASGKFKVGDKFFTTASTGDTEIRGDLTVGQATATHIMTSLQAQSAALIVATASQSGTSAIRLGRTDASPFEIAQTNGQLSIASSDNTGVLGMTAAAAKLSLTGSFAINTDEFTVNGGTGKFAGNLAVGSAVGTNGPRQLVVQAATAPASMRVVPGPGHSATISLAAGDATAAGSEISQLGQALTLRSLDAAGTIMISPGTDAAAKLMVTSDVNVQRGTKSVAFQVSQASAALSLSDTATSVSTISQASDTMTLSCLDGAAGTVNIQAGAAVRLNQDKLVIHSASGEVHTAADVLVGGTGTEASTRVITVRSTGGDAKLKLQPSAVNSGSAAIVFGSDATNTFSITKNGDTLQMSAAGSSAGIDLQPQGSLTVGGGVFSVGAANGNVAMAGDVSVGCVTCSGQRTASVMSSDNHVSLNLGSVDPTKSATLSLGYGTNRFLLAQSAQALSIRGASVAAEINLLPFGFDVTGQSVGRVTVGDGRFVVDAADGATVAQGDLTVGGAAVAGARSATVRSADMDVKLELHAGVGKAATLGFGDGSGQSFEISQLPPQTLSLAASGFTTGVLSLDPGSAGQLQVGTRASPTLVLDLASQTMSLAGSLALSSTSSARALSISSTASSVSVAAEGATGATMSVAALGSQADASSSVQATDGAASLSVRASGASNTATLAVRSTAGPASMEVSSGSLAAASTFQLGTGENGAELEVLSTTLTLRSRHRAGVIKLSPGTTSGMVNIADGLLTVQPSVGASGTVATSGDLSVGGTLSLRALSLPSGSASGTSGQTINEPAGLLTRVTSSLARASSASASQVVPVELVALTNSKITAASVVVASVVSQCNANTVVAILKIEPRAGGVDFTLANVGIGDCNNEAYTLSFLVMS
jgi:hypothetical protein